MKGKLIKSDFLRFLLIRYKIMYNKNIIQQYERALKDPSILHVDTYNFKNMTVNSQTNIAKDVFKYAIECILHYTPGEAKLYFNHEIMKQLKLDYLVKYMQVPTGLNESEEVIWILSICFPPQIYFSREKKIIEIYENVLAAKKDEGKSFTWPKGFFSNYDRWINSAICLQYMIQRYLKYSSINDLYEQFNDSTTMMKTLTKYSLSKPAKKLYKSNTLEYLQDSLCPENRSDFMYYKCLFNNKFKSVLKEHKNSALNDLKSDL